MTSFQLGVTPHRKAAARFVDKVRRNLQKAFADRSEVTQTQIADALGVHRSVINRQLRGTADISLGRVAELAHVLGYRPEFSLVKDEPEAGSNVPLILPPQTKFTMNAVPSTGVSQLKASSLQLEDA